MADLTQAIEMFEEMAQRGVFSPATEQETFAMPTMLQAVPTRTTYATPVMPLNLGTTNAGLEKRPSRNCD